MLHTRGGKRRNLNWSSNRIRSRMSLIYPAKFVCWQYLQKFRGLNALFHNLKLQKKLFFLVCGTLPDPPVGMHNDWQPPFQKILDLPLNYVSSLRAIHVTVGAGTPIISALKLSSTPVAIKQSSSRSILSQMKKTYKPYSWMLTAK